VCRNEVDVSTNNYDAVIVGGGIGGGALATVLARAGKSVLVLEKSTVYRDRVRGEWIAMWGVEELKTLGLYDEFIAAGGHHLTRHISYGDETTPQEAEAAALPLGALTPGIPGPMTIGHPASCNMLADLAARAGAAVLRGVEDVKVTPGASPSVSYLHDGAWHDAACRIIVGADGRGSQVRQALGIELHQDPQHHFFTGMLVENAHGFPDDLQVIGTENDVHFLVFPQSNGRARLYLGYPTGHPSRFSGDGGQRRFLDAFKLKSMPCSDAIVNSTPAGPCNSYPNQDAWTDAPYGQGAVLVGDAAGYNDPIIGQGLSITYRDVRIVRDILLSHHDWSDPSSFVPYGEERAERLRRLRFSARMQSIVQNEFGDAALERRKKTAAARAADPTLMLPLIATLIGPDKVPGELFDDSTLAKTCGETVAS
jgi:2-polyprenyl-6-methoxyphenol hydroxylase-like FAD-dependent oxidoreductase